MAAGGTKLERNRPCSSSSASQAASATSLLRPGKIFTCLAFTSSSSKPRRASRTYQTGFQYWPVASITTWVTPSAPSQAAISSNAPVNVENVRISWRRRPAPPGVRTATTTSSLPTSNPAHRSTITSMT